MTISDPFALEEGGGGLDGFTGTITDAFFSDGEYGLSLRLVSTFDDPENYVRFEDGTFTQYYSCGKGWQTPDAGDTAVHESGDPSKRFNKSSKVGQLIAQVGQIPGITDALPADFSVYTAKSWKGLHLVWGRVETPGRKQIDGVWTDTVNNVLLPIALAGTGAASTNGAAPVDVNSLGLDTETITALSLIAQTCDTDAKFIEELAKQGLVGNATLMGAVGKNTKGVREALAAATF